MHQNTPLETDLRLKAAAGLELEVAKDMEKPDKCLGKLLDTVAQDKEAEEDEDEDQNIEDSSV